MSDINRERLAEMFSGMDWASIDELYNAALTAGVFSSSHFAKCIVQHSKAMLRQALKSGKLRQPDGSAIKVASIIMTTESRKKVQVYKREDLFVKDDFFQVVSYWDRYEKRGKKMKQYKVKLAKVKFGTNFTKLLPCFKQEVLL